MAFYTIGVRRSLGVCRDGQLQPSKKQVSLRGLNCNQHHELKNIFKGAALIAATKVWPFQEFYAALNASRMRPEMARLNLARKLAAIILIVWKKGGIERPFYGRRHRGRVRAIARQGRECFLNQM